MIMTECLVQIALIKCYHITQPCVKPFDGIKKLVFIKTFHHEISPALVGPQLPDPEHQALAEFHYLTKLPPTEKKTNPAMTITSIKSILKN